MLSLLCFPRLSLTVNKGIFKSLFRNLLAHSVLADPPNTSLLLLCNTTLHALLIMRAGFFNPFASHGSYYPCPAGSFASAPGASACTLCPAGTFSAAQFGATTCRECALALRPGAASCVVGEFQYIHHAENFPFGLFSHFVRDPVPTIQLTQNA